MLSSEFDLDREIVMRISKPLFYGFILLSGISMFAVSVSYAGTLLGMAVLPYIAFVAAGLAESMEDDWANFLDLIAVSTLLISVVFASYTSAYLSFL